MKTQKNKTLLFACSLWLNYLVVIFYNLEISFRDMAVIHCFMFGLSFFSEKLQKTSKKQNNIIVFQSLAINGLRIFACFIFLYPIIFRRIKVDHTYIYNFLSIYFIYLFFEIFFEYQKKKK